MARKLNDRLAKIDRTYTVEEVARRWGGEDDANAARRRPAGPVFRVVKAWCRKDSPLTSRARHVLIHIAIRMGADDEGRQVAFMGQETLVGDTGLSLSSVRRAVKELRDVGVIKTSEGGVTRGYPHRCNEYELTG